MFSIKKMVSCIFGLAALCMLSFAAENDSTAGKEVPAPGNVFEDTWIYFSDEPSNEFLAAYDYFLNDNPKLSAAHIRKGAAYIDFESYRSTGESRKELQSSSKELKELSNLVMEGKVKSVEQLQKTFARAEYQLTVHHYKKACEFEKNQKTIATGYAMAAARKHLRQAWAWSESSISIVDAAALKQIAILSTNLCEGKKSTPQKVREALDTIDKAIVRFIDRLKKKK